MPKHEESDSDDMEEEGIQELRLLQNSGAGAGNFARAGGKPVVSNGVHGNQPVSSDLLQVISQLDSGRFDSA